MYKGQITYQDVIEKIAKHAGFNFIKSEDVFYLYLIKKYAVTANLLRFLEKHGFKKEVDPARGEILIDKKFQEESRKQMPLSNCSWVTLPIGMPKNKQSLIGAGVQFDINNKDSYVIISPRIYVPYEKPNSELPHHRLFDILLDYNNGSPKPKGEIIKQMRQSGQSLILFNKLGIQGAKILFPQTTKDKKHPIF